MPLADKMRPKKIEDMVGQRHIIGKGKVLNKIIENKSIPNMILYGPPGTGKTTLANIVANTTGKKYVKLNAVNCGVKEIKEIIDENKAYVTITEGKYHQVKRMFKHFGLRVTYLKRLEMGPLVLDDDLASGEYRELSKDEINFLLKHKDN